MTSKQSASPNRTSNYFGYGQINLSYIEHFITEILASFRPTTWMIEAGFVTVARAVLASHGRSIISVELE
jgi:hypothetical protein